MRMRIELRTTSGIRGDAYYDGSRWREPQGELSHLFEWQVTFAIVGFVTDRRVLDDNSFGEIVRREEAGSVFVYAERGSDPGFPVLERAALWAAENSSLRDPKLDVALAFAAWSEARESKIAHAATEKSEDILR